MSKRPHTFIALLRGINVGGHNKVPMADLRALCTDLGWDDVRTYIQSGNVVFTAGKKPADLERDLERAIEKEFGLSIHVVVRSAADWKKYVGENPFPGPSKKTPNFVGLALSKKPPHRDAPAALRERAAHGEEVERAGKNLWIHFRAGAGKSKLTPALFDRLVGSPVTIRNWRTVLKLDEMARGDD